MELFYSFNEGERILLRRGLASLSQHFNQQLLSHKGDEYEAKLDRERLAAIAALSDKILKEGKAK